MTLAALALVGVLVWDSGGRADVPPEVWNREGHPTLAVPPVNFAVQLTVNGVPVFGPDLPTGAQVWQTTDLTLVDLTPYVDGQLPELRWRAAGERAGADQLPPIRLGPRAEIEAWAFWPRFWGSQMLFAASAGALLLVAFSLMGLAARRRRTTGVWFTVAGLSFVVTWLPGIPAAGVGGPLLWFLSTAALLLDAAGWTGPGRRWFPWLAVGPIILAGAALMVHTVAELQGVRAAAVWWFVVEYGATAVLGLIVAARQRRWGLWLVVPGLLLLVPALAIHDGGLVTGYRPMVPLSPYAASVVGAVFLGRWARTWWTNRELLTLRTQELVDLNRRMHDEVDSRNEDLSQFVSVLSHDMKNSLYGLRQVTRRLAQDPQPQPQLMVTLDETVHRVQAVLQSLLNLSSSSMGTLHPVPVEVSAGELWDRLEAEVTEDATGRGVRVERNGDESARFATDPAMATTILRNFFGNAVKVSPPGATIRLLTRTTEAEVVLAVIDSGPGLSADQVGGLFDLESRRVMMRPGDQPKGFGLILARNLADRLGHRIDVRSTPRVGSSFALVVRV